MRLEVIMFENCVLAGHDAFGDSVWSEMTCFTMQPVVTMDAAPIICKLQRDGYYQTAEAVPLEEFQRRHATHNDYLDKLEPLNLLLKRKDYVRLLPRK